jgi:tRNA-(ms[2]io[6]A)-hydroxylase
MAGRGKRIVEPPDTSRTVARASYSGVVAPDTRFFEERPEPGEARDRQPEVSQRSGPLDFRGCGPVHCGPPGMFDLRLKTSEEWLDVVFSDFDAFIVDHALCERKASAMGMSLVAKYPDRTRILEPLIAFAREELEHFHIVYRLIEKRGLRLVDDEKDAYVNGLRKHMRAEGDARFLDRLLIPGVVEARGCERLGLVAGALSDDELRRVYLELTRAESRHHALFFRLARCYFEEETVRERARQLLDVEAELVARLPHRPAVH